MGLKAHAPSVVSVALGAGNLKVDAGSGVQALGCGHVDLIEWNLFVMLGIKIGESFCGHQVVPHLDRSAAALEDHGKGLVWHGRRGGAGISNRRGITFTWVGRALVWIRVCRSRTILVSPIVAWLGVAGLRDIGRRIIGVAPIVETEVVSIGIEEVRIAGPIGIRGDIPILKLTASRIEAIAILIPASILVEAARRAGSARVVRRAAWRELILVIGRSPAWLAVGSETNIGAIASWRRGPREAARSGESGTRGEAGGA